jgi:hypothetical protein
MKASADGFPEPGASSRTLGARSADLPISNGSVSPLTGGMSVSPSLAELPIALTPKRLAYLREGAIGPDSSRVWSHGAGPFIQGAVAPHLAFRPDRPGHGLVEPAAEMGFADYQDALHATRGAWIVDEN